MRVLFVTEDLSSGGSERVVSVLANGFAGGHEPAVAAIRRDRVTYQLDRRVKYYAFSEENKGKIRRTAGRILFLLRAIQDDRPDIVVAFDVVPILYASLCCTLLRKKLVVSERGDPRKHLGKGMITRRYFKAFDRAAGAVFQTGEARQCYPAGVQKKSVIIPNPIPEEFAGGLYEGERAKEIVTACRLTPQKNIRLFIDIVSAIVDRYPQYQGIIYGDGPERANLTRYAFQKGAEKCITFAGKADHIKERLMKSQFYLCTSDYEGISNAMLEAMSLGLNVIATDCPVGGARMAITTGVDGVLFPVGDREAGIAAIVHLIENPALSEAMGREAVKIRERWSSRRILRKWIDYLNEITGE